MGIELTPRPTVMALARWIEILVQDGESLERIQAAVELTTGQSMYRPEGEKNGAQEGSQP